MNHLTIRVYPQGSGAGIKTIISEIEIFLGV
jgi:hypothetical protein